MVSIQEYLSVTKKNNFEGGDDYKMKMNSLISWVGGKKSIRDLIYARFPQSYGRYIEVFGGGGWVLFGKKPDKFEVYNDFNNNLSNMFAVVRNQPLAFIQELGYLPENGRNIFNLYKEIITKAKSGR